MQEIVQFFLRSLEPAHGLELLQLDLDLGHLILGLMIVGMKMAETLSFLEKLLLRRQLLDEDLNIGILLHLALPI
ncbi:hypothetical protein D3C76_1788190 [compost metagenome]